MKKTIYTLSLISLCFSCKTTNNVVKSKTNDINQTMQNKITIQDLEKHESIVIKTNRGQEVVYPVIIHTDNSEELKQNDIIVQSVSKTFVTALIKTTDLNKIYKLKSVKLIELPVKDQLH